MTSEQVKHFVEDAVLSHPPREVTVRTNKGEVITGEVHYTGHRVFRVDHPLAACFFEYDEVEEIV